MASASEEILRALIGFPTVSRDSNLDLIAYIESYLDKRGIESLRVESEDRRKSNLFATVGPKDQSGIMLSGHTDVVPIDGQDWATDPFELTMQGDRLFGRGSVDMKGFIACTLALLDRIDISALKTPIHLAYSYDEEVGCLGVRHLIDMIDKQPVKPLFCIVGEPTSLQVITAHKGKYSFRATFGGVACHSSLAPMGKNAIHFASDFIQFLRRLQDEIERSWQHDGDYDVAYTTVHAGVIKGGTVLNIVPNQCEVEFEMRFLPDDPIELLINRIEEYIDKLGRKAGAPIRLDQLSGYAGMTTPPDSNVVAFMRSIVGANSLGKISFGTEGGLISERLDIPTIVCGPGSIARAHRPDEFITRTELASCDHMLDRLADKLQHQEPPD